MSELLTSSQVVWGNTFMMYFKSHSYHWNVEGMNFGELHGFFGDLYDDAHDAVDAIAEEIRALGSYAPHSLKEVSKFATIEDDDSKPFSPREMLTNLQDANKEVIESLNKLFDTATAQKKQGLANWAADRLDKHNKHGWMIQSYLKG